MRPIHLWAIPRTAVVIIPATALSARSLVRTADPTDRAPTPESAVRTERYRTDRRSRPTPRTPHAALNPANPVHIFSPRFRPRSVIHGVIGVRRAPEGRGDRGLGDVAVGISRGTRPCIERGLADRRSARTGTLAPCPRGPRRRPESRDFRRRPHAQCPQPVPRDLRQPATRA